MALVLANRVQETTTTTGTGTVTLAGAMSGFQSFAVVGDTNTTYYAITSGTAWEVGIGTYSTTGPTLARTTILSSSIGGGAITLAGTSIVFATYPSEKSVNYDASSNVGIGTTSPTVKLDVLVADGAEATKLRGATGRMRVRPYVDATNGSFIDAVNTAESAYIPLSLAGSSIRLTTNGGLAATVDASANVGIGTASPSMPLNVSKNGTDSGLGYSNVSKFVDGSGNKGLLVGYDNSAQTTVLTANTTSASSNMTFWTYESGVSGWAERMRVTAAGNVGIGTSSPTQKLDVGAGGNVVLTGASTGDQFIKVGFGRSGNGYSFIDFQGDTTYSNGLRIIRTNGGANTSSNIEHRGTGALSLITQEAGPITFLTTATERMRIDTSGNVAIGTSTAISKLTISSSGDNGILLDVPVSSVVYAEVKARYQGQNNCQAAIRFYNPNNAYGGAFTVWTQPESNLAAMVERFRITTTGGITSSDLADAVGYKGLPQNSQTASYTLALTDMGKMVNTTTGGVVIPANASVAFPIGSTVVVYNNSASSQTISITTDTLYLAGTATTGSRTLAQRGLATCVKVASTTWVVSGNVT